MISIIKADGTSEVRQLEAMRARAAQKNADIELAVSAVMQNIKENGLSAVRDYSRQFDHREPYELTRAQLEEAYRSCPAELIAALEHAAANIRDYNEKLLSRTMEWTSPDGGRVGRIVRGLSRVGIYVPGGTAAYPSSVLMNAVPAKVAGVEEIVMVTPPTENLNAAVLAAARIAGVDRCIAVGGAQAVAALTYGAGFIPRVDKLVGPGNAYVAAAKRLAYGSLDIDMVAGPSEVLVMPTGRRTRSTWPRTCSARRSTTGWPQPCCSPTAGSWPRRWTGRWSGRPGIWSARRSWRNPCGTSGAPSSVTAWSAVWSWQTRSPRSTLRS